MYILYKYYIYLIEETHSSMSYSTASVSFSTEYMSKSTEYMSKSTEYNKNTVYNHILLVLS